GGFNNPDLNQRDLFSACNAMIESSNELDGQRGSATDRSLGLSEQELAAALQDLAHEEIITQGTMATETSSAQQANIDMRLSQLLGKVPSISVTGLQFKQNGKTLMADALGFKYGQRGGAAGDGDAGWRKLGVFINGSIGFGEKEGTDREDAFDFDTSGITVGVDYRLTNQFVLGVAAGYNKLGSDIVHTASVSGGSVDADGYSLSGYGLYYLDNFYVNGVITYTSNDYDIERRVVILSNNPSIPTINRTASANTDSDQIAFSATAGYELSREAWTFGPYARLDYLDVDIDGYTETGAGGLNLQVN
ncbi:outer membrane autotransporter barrel domain protein, partial [Candidatus Thiomargarita nelsonii]